MNAIRILLLSLLPVAAAPQALADEPGGCIAIIGTGSVGGALGPRFAGIGERIVYGSRTPDEERVQNLVARSGQDASAVTPAEAAAACGTVVLAVPWSAVEGIVATFGSLAGKRVIDVTNPLGVRDGREFAFEVPGKVSGGEYLQSLLPGAKVVKAFNTVNFRVMADPALAGGPVTIPLAGDADDAKLRVADLVSGIGLEPLDVGPLRIARYTEAMALLYVSRLVSGKRPFEFYLRTRPAN
ncbi:MAG: NADPH-dependent F420 reductase [Gammaproteobacteria bacterium]